MQDKNKLNQPRVLKAWAFYDWANSVYSLVITSAIFPVFYSAITFAGKRDEISILGFKPETAFNFSLAISFFIIIFLSPILSSIADHKGNKLTFLKGFCYFGALSCMGLAFTSSENVLIGLFFTITASIGFWGSLVFYNSYLPEIATKDRMDALSAKGFITGYIGSIILLILCLIIIETSPLENKGFATKICFVLTGLWWLGFAQYTFKNLPKNKKEKNSEISIISKSIEDLNIIIQDFSKLKNLKTFLAGFFFYSLGIQTIFLMAALFGSSVLQMEDSKLILTILLIQIEAIFGAWLFSYLSKKYGNKSTLLFGVLVWIVVCVLGYLIDPKHPDKDLHFYFIAGLVGLVMGGIQSLSRSTYAKLLSNIKETTTYFSFYDVFEKVALLFGLIIFGMLVEFGGGMKIAVLSMGVSFLVSFLILLYFKTPISSDKS